MTQKQITDMLYEDILENYGAGIKEIKKLVKQKYGSEV